MNNAKSKFYKTITFAIVILSMQSCNSSKGGGCGYWSNGEFNKKEEIKDLKAHTYIVKYKNC